VNVADINIQQSRLYSLLKLTAFLSKKRLHSAYAKALGLIALTSRWTALFYISLVIRLTCRSARVALINIINIARRHSVQNTRMQIAEERTDFFAYNLRIVE
jgi:hypothetical protein